MKTPVKIAAVLALILVLAAGVGYGILYGNQGSSQQEQAQSDGRTEVPSLSPETVLAEVGEGRTQVLLEGDHITVTGKGASASQTVVTISQAGAYELSGALTEGQIYVEAGKEDTIVLYLNGVEISNSDEAAIHIENAGRILLVLEDNTANRIQSGIQTSLGAVEDSADETVTGGAIYARNSLMISGTGSLQVLGYINNGIHTTKDLLIESGQIEVTAVNNGLKGKDSVTITGGTFSISSGGDAIKSDDTTGVGYGTVSITGGTFSIVTASDGVQAETVLEIDGGTFTVQSGNSRSNTAYSDGGSISLIAFGGGMFPGDGDGMETPPDGEGNGGRPGRGDGNLPDDFEGGGNPFGGGFGGFGGGEKPDDFGNGENPPGGFGGGGFGGDFNQDWDWDTDSSVSTKAFKCGTEMIITGGAFTVNSAEDAFHSNGSMKITGGEFTVVSGDDAYHADTELIIEDGVIQITQSNEGIEANQILIQGGDISIVASDDGINANGGQSGFGFGFGGWGGAANAAEDMPNLKITGGTIWVQANGDGLDSNGNIYVEGGTVIVDGPTNNGNGALDVGTENGGICEISGGTVLAIGSSGMAETFGNTSSQCSFLYNFSSTIAAGSEITITDAEGNILFEHTSAKNSNSVVFSCPELKQGETYQLKAGKETVEITLDSISTSVGASSFGRGWRR